MKNASARTTYLKDYSPPPFTIETTDLSFDLYEDHASVVSKLLFTRSTHEGAANATSLELHVIFFPFYLIVNFFNPVLMHNRQLFFQNMQEFLKV